MALSAVLGGGRPSTSPAGPESTALDKQYAAFAFRVSAGHWRLYSAKSKQSSKVSRDCCRATTIGRVGAGCGGMLSTARGIDFRLTCDGYERPNRFTALQEATVLLFDKRLNVKAPAKIGRVNRPSLVDLLRHEASQLLALSHPRILHALHGIEENK